VKLSLAIVVIILLLFIIKGVYIATGVQIDKSYYEANKILLETLGFDFRPVDNNPDKMLIRVWSSLQFESIALVINVLLLVYYYQLSENRRRKDPYGYINHSMFLKYFRVFQNMFFLAILLDACFATTIIQMVLLGNNNYYLMM